MNLDDFGVFNTQSEMVKPLILSDEHALYLYEHDSLTAQYDRQINDKLAEEKAEKLEIESRKNCKKSNYIRVGGN